VEHHLAQLFPELGTRTRRRTRRRQGDTDLITALLRSNRFVLLLDGFDEVAPARRGELLTALNDELWLDQAVIMTSRYDTYTEAGAALRNAATMVIEPLPQDGIVDWLETVFPSDFGRWQPVVRALRTSGTPVSQALSTPLMVTLAAKVFEAPTSDPGELAKHPNPESITRHLLGQFVPVVYDRGRSRWPASRARGWLELLATRMVYDDERGIAWWRLYTFVPRWLFAILFGAALGLCVGFVTAYAAAIVVGAVPADPVPYQTVDFFNSPALILQSMLENSIRSLSRDVEPSAAVSAVTAGSAFGAGTAAWVSATLLSHRDTSWWRRISWTRSQSDQRRISWTRSQSDQRGVREAVRDIGYSIASAAVVGGALGAVSGAATGLAVVFGDDTSSTFLLAVRVGTRVGVVVGALVGLLGGLFDEPGSRWGRPAPAAPTTVDLRATVLQPKKIAVVAGLGFAVGAGLALFVGRHPTLFGALGAVIAVVVLLLATADDITESGALTSADLWSATRPKTLGSSCATTSRHRPSGLSQRSSSPLRSCSSRRLSPALALSSSRPWSMSCSPCSMRSGSGRGVGGSPLLSH